MDEFLDEEEERQWRIQCLELLLEERGEKEPHKQAVHMVEQADEERSSKQ